MTDKTFTRAGRSTNKGKTQLRFTNDVNRERVLAKNGHTDIEFFELGSAMTKAEATEFLVSQGITEDKPKPKAKTPTRADDKAELSKLNQNKVAYDEQSDSFRKILAEKRQAFPSHSDEQIREIAQFQAQCNQKAFGAAEPTF